MKPALMLFILSLAPLAYGQSCTDFNPPPADLGISNSDTTGHDGTVGSHSVTIAEKIKDQDRETFLEVNSLY